MPLIRSLPLAVGLMALTCTLTLAQDVPRASIRTSQVHSIHSPIAGGVDYEIVVSVPLDYSASSERYPVVYYLDAWYAAGGVEETYHWLRAFDDIPPLILVGISWRTDGAGARDHRTRDFTPTHLATRPTSGGAEAFFQFLTGEVIPFVEREYRTVESPRGLMGYSLGGLFGAWVLFNHPGTFDRYPLCLHSVRHFSFVN
jgi:predicted alpha/beta superfamily hydrolase